LSKQKGPVQTGDQLSAVEAQRQGLAEEYAQLYEKEEAWRDELKKSEEALGQIIVHIED
jgi:hypothetical protein